ncbi:MAG: tetratricopeptide repeat protein [Planctomycetaceae bacterium]|nr:tetratricopeptide repeat protein [Planctomycetaceae bacterium]
MVGPVRGWACLLVGFAAVQGGVAHAQVTAQTLIGKAVSDDSQNKEINNAISRFRDRDIDGCRAILERARSNNAKLPPPGVMMATLWLSVNQLGPARGELEDTAVKFAADPEPFLMLGDLAFQDRRITDAAVLFEKATALTAAFTENAKRKRDFDIRCHAGNAAVAEARRQWEQAQKHLQGWLDLDPDNASARQRMGIVLFNLGKEQESLVQFKEARKLDGKAVQPELALARLYDEAKKRDTAKKLIEAAIKAAPNDPGVLLASAQWYLGQNDLETAKVTAENALKLDPKSLDGKIVRGAIARVARDYRTAEKFFNEAHVQSPGNFPASNSLALVLVESDDEAARQRATEMAEANVAMYRENSPQQVNALTTLAWVYYKRLTTDGAYYVSKLLADRGEKDRARKILEEVLANEPMFATRPDAVDLLARLKKEAGGGN